MKITRKELAAKISKLIEDEVTPDQVRRNEKRWGLGPSRHDRNKRVVRYDEASAIAAVRKALKVPASAGS